jgi:tetratricopeptide (TPR) repeat protein
MSNQNPILRTTSIALLSILSIYLPAQAIESNSPISNYIAQNQTATQFNEEGMKKFRKGDYQGALADFNKAIELDPKFLNAYSNRAVLKQVALKDYGGALADYNKAVELNPKNAATYNNRAALKEDHLKDYLGALADYNKVIEINPKFAAAYYNRAFLKYHKLKDTQGGIADLRQTAKIARERGETSLLQKVLKDLKDMGLSE